MRFDSYQDIFNARGMAYHKAMELVPNARDHEFKTLIQQAQLEKGLVVCDLPSGGGYLENYLTEFSPDLILIEQSQAFYDLIPKRSNSRKLLCDLEQLTLPSEHLDLALSLAGLHHAENRLDIFKEIHRVLKVGGKFCLADVREGSAVDKFLNIFVDENNSAGHIGTFINNQFIGELEQAKFSILQDKPIRYPWVFSSQEEMANYCRLMFGMDKANLEQVLAGIDKYLGFEEKDGKCYLNWELEFVTCLKR